MTIHYLYLITRSDGEQYVGVTVDPDRRRRDHKNGWGSIHLEGKTFTMDILRSGTAEEMYSIEQEYIEKHNCSLNIAKGGTIDNSRPKNWVKGSSHYKTRLSEEDVIKIRELRAEGKNAEFIAPLFGISKTTVSHICVGRTWKHVKGPLTKASPDQYIDGISLEKRFLIRKLALEGLMGTQIRDIVKVGQTTIYRYWKNTKYDPINR